MDRIDDTKDRAKMIEREDPETLKDRGPSDIDFEKCPQCGGRFRTGATHKCPPDLGT